MGQKLEKLSEKDGESNDNSDWSERTAETQQSEPRERDKSRDQEDQDSFMTPHCIDEISGISVSDTTTGHAGEHTVTSASTDPHTGQPIRPLGQQEHPLGTRGERVGGDREGRGVSRTLEESKTVLNRKATRPKQVSEGTAEAFTGTAAMDELGSRKKSETSWSKLGPGTQTRSLTTQCNPTNEEDFVLLEKDETWKSSDRETFGSKIKTENPISSIKRREDEDTSASYGDNNLPQPSRNTAQEKGNDKKSREKSDTLLVMTDRVEAHAESSPTACFERKMGQHLAEVTGGRCQLKGVSHVGAAHTETTGRGEAEREQSMNDHSKRQMYTHNNKEPLTAQSNSGSVKRLKESTGDLENIHDKAVQLTSQQERAVKSNLEPCLENSLRESQNQEEENYNSGFNAHKSQADQSQSWFADAVSRRAKAGPLCSYDMKEAKLLSSEIPQLHDAPSFSLEQCDLIPCLPLPENEGSDEKPQITSYKRESEPVCFSPVITPPPLTHLLPDKDTVMAAQLNTNVINSQMVPNATPNPCESKVEFVPKEKPKVKGPPPPVPKKPKNPFIKLKTAQLMSTDGQRRGKDHLRSEERAKRRHTFHFNKDLPYNPQANQDMCLHWDERGTYSVPTNIRHLTLDLDPREHLSLRHMDDHYGDMVDFGYCTRVAQLSPDEEPQNLDMLKRRVFLERRDKYKNPPPPVKKKPSNAFASKEISHIPEVTSDKEIQRPKPACSGKRESYPELLSERISTEVSDNNYAHYGNRREVTDHIKGRFVGDDNEVGSYKPVAKIIKEANQKQRHQDWVKPEGAAAQARVTEQSPSVNVSQMKNAFDVPKKPKEKPLEVQPPPKKVVYETHYKTNLMNSLFAA